MHFAARTDFGWNDSEYGAALSTARAQGPLLDLTITNPTRCGLHLPDGMLSPLVAAESLQYDPEPLGARSARQAVSHMYRERWQAAVPPEHLLLTASTSESYSYLFRLFCEPGDAVLVPSPSYPLFDLLARLHDVDLVKYPLVYHDGWQIDPASLHASVTERTRALIVIHPNNPTGHYCSRADRDTLLECARKHDLPLIVDEVFLDYAIEQGEPVSFAAQAWREQGGKEHVPLTFVLGGLSKLLCLPQMKLAWTAVCGEPTDVSVAMHRLEVIADTFLSVASPPQMALPTWLAHRPAIQQGVLARVQTNLAALDCLLAGTLVSRLRVEGGWAAVLRVPAHDADVNLAVRLLRMHRLAVHPGSFYGFPPQGWLVVSLLAPQTMFEQAVRLLLKSF